jgi:hypothetical protein
MSYRPGAASSCELRVRRACSTDPEGVDHADPPEGRVDAGRFADASHAVSTTTITPAA